MAVSGGDTPQKGSITCQVAEAGVVRCGCSLVPEVSSEGPRGDQFHRASWYREHFGFFYERDGSLGGSIYSSTGFEILPAAKYSVDWTEVFNRSSVMDNFCYHIKN